MHTLSWSASVRSFFGVPGGHPVCDGTACYRGYRYRRRLPVHSAGTKVAIPLGDIDRVGTHDGGEVECADIRTCRPEYAVHGKRSHSCSSPSIGRKPRRSACRCRRLRRPWRTFMGSAYINDFDFNNRSYRVYIQADKQYRRNSQDLKQFLRAVKRRPDGAAGQLGSPCRKQADHR